MGAAMSRALDVICGVSLIASLWGMTLATLPVERLPTWGAGWVLLLCFFKLCVACAITGPVYREYLK